MAVEALAEQRPFFTASVLKRLLDSYLSTERVDADPLTNQERLVVQLVAEGQTNKEIARIMNLSVKTVETHRAAAMSKLGCSSIADLVRYAVRSRLAEA
jgi:DNA-binding NarL/FixJ family response regulator